MERLQSFIPQIDDLGRDGFPYLEGARARTELQLKECIRKTFGDKSPEFQAYRQHRLSADTPVDTKQIVAFIKNLIASLEDKKLELQGLKPPPTPPVEPPQTPAPTARPHMALVPPTPTAQVTISPAAPLTPPPVTMSVALTTNLDMAQAAATQPVVPSQPVAASQPSSPPATSTPVTAAVSSPPVLEVAASPQAAPLGKPAAPPVPISSQPSVESPGPSAGTPVPTHEPFAQSKADASVSTQSAHDPCETVKSLCKRFHLVARQLRLRGEYRATLDVEDELDVQDLLHALLRVHFDDIETDEWLPSYSNGAPRIMFLLNDSRLAVVVKKTRIGLNAKDLADQLRIDVDHCRTLKRCSTLLCFVYDPEGRIGNPRGLEADLISISDQLTADVYVAPK